MNDEFNNTRKQLEMLGNIKVVDIKDNEDGSANVVFDLDQRFIKNYNQLFHLAEWDQKHFENTLEKAMLDMIDKHESKNQQNPDFVWSQPKEENE